MGPDYASGFPRQNDISVLVVSMKVRTVIKRIVAETIDFVGESFDGNEFVRRFDAIWTLEDSRTKINSLTKPVCSERTQCGQQTLSRKEFLHWISFTGN